jgi:hypothetical protein
MEVQNCAYEPSNTYNSDSDYGKINITSVIMCFLIIYSTALSIMLSIIQLIQVIKEEELLNEEEEEEEEVIKEVIDRLEVQTQTNEENYKKEEEKKDDEEEILLANYNAKERALALQTAYEERAKLTFEKWREAHLKLFTIKQRISSNMLSTADFEAPHMLYRTFLSKVQEEYFQTNEKLTRLEAFNALKKARTIDLEHYKEFIHLFNS